MFYCYLLLLYSFGHQKGYNHPDSLYLFRYLQQLAEQTDPVMIGNSFINVIRVQYFIKKFWEMVWCKFRTCVILTRQLLFN